MQPRRRRLWSALLLGQLLGICCMADPDPEAIAFAPERVGAEIRIMVLTPISLPGELTDHSDAMGQFDSLIAEMLEETRLDPYQLISTQQSGREYWVGTKRRSTR
jgi:hypothetical protein